jgi:hypothetical protein
LGHLTIGKALAIQCSQGKKAVHQAFHVLHGHLFSSQRDYLERARQASMRNQKSPNFYHVIETVSSRKLLPMHWSEVTSFFLVSGATYGYESNRKKSPIDSLPNLWREAGREV